MGESPRSYFFYFFFWRGVFFSFGLGRVISLSFGLGLVWGFEELCWVSVAMRQQTTRHYHTFQHPRPAMQLRPQPRPRPLIDLLPKPWGITYTYTAKTSSHTEPPQLQKSSLASHIDLSSPGLTGADFWSVYGMGARWDGSGLLFLLCDLYQKEKKGKSRSFKGTGREGLPHTKYTFREILFVGLVLVGRGDFL